MFALLPLLMATPLAAQEALGVFEGWGAFAQEQECYAIARPERVAGGETARAYAGFAFAKGGLPRFYARLSRERRAGTSLTVTLGGRRFRLTGKGREALAAKAATDRAILSALRMANAMSIEGTDMQGRPIVDAYALAGGPSAIDAARLSCLSR
ncbi:MAG: hypothetical protein CMN74_00615 [Sphingorhabdus sp.]|nr:hypothetical protein [Sphingorhabdus sp.]|tara:strand:- start:55 stop:516 length:462 start_codon:yes stop_codon:yes gene_type:complete